MAERYTIEGNRCLCHPETCACAPWRVLKDGERFLSAMTRAAAEAAATALNAAAGVRASEAPRYYCNKCGSFPSAREHNRPNGTPCPYLASGGNAGVEGTQPAAEPNLLEQAAAICDALAKLYPREDVGFDTGYRMGCQRAAREIRARGVDASHTVSGLMDLLRELGCHPQDSDSIRRVREYAAQISDGVKGGA